MKKALFLLLGLSALMIPASAFAQSGGDADLDGVPNDMDAFPCDSGPSAVRFFPGQGQFATMFFEDQWPSRGDNDFNDVVLAYNFIIVTNASGQVYEIRANYNAPAIGGEFNNGLGLSIPVPTSQVASVTRQIGRGAPVESLTPEATDSDLVIRLLDNVRALYNDQAGTINSDPGRAAAAGKPVEVIIRFTQPVTIDFSQVPFDTFIFRSQDFTHQIHRPQYVGTAAMNTGLFRSEDDGSDDTRHYVDQSGLPFALLVPASTLWPREGTPISQLYPQIAIFASSGGTQGADFYQSQVQVENGWTHGSNGQAAAAPSFVGAADEPGNGACIIPWRTGGGQYGGSSNETTWQSFTSDSQGNLLVAGNTSGVIPGGTSAGSGDMFLMKYSPSGQLLWSRQRGTNLNDIPLSITVDGANNIYVGVATGSGAAFVSNIYKYSPDGTPLWYSNNPVGCGSLPTSMAIAPDGSLMLGSGCVYGIGRATPDLPTFSGWSAMTVKLSSVDGSLIWARIGDSSENNTVGSGIAVDDHGNSYTYISHMVRGQSLTKRDPDGNLIYRVQTDNQPLWLGGQVRLSGDTLVLTRPFSGMMNGVASTAGTWDFAVQKLATSDGHQIWMRVVGSTGLDYGYSSVFFVGSNGVDSAGNIYVAGTTSGVFPGNYSRGGYDYFVSKLDTNGTILWTSQYGTSGSDYATGVGWEPVTGTVYVGGQTTGAFPGSSNVGGWDVFLMKHDPATGSVL